MATDTDHPDYPDFQDPGGRSALRRARKGNPRNRSCPTCKRRNVLTPADVALGYQRQRARDEHYMAMHPWAPDCGNPTREGFHPAGEGSADA